jgi:dihydroorotate dehydrogenase electron transfer subunit
MLKETARIAEENDVAAQVSMDAYMACGIGVCRGCAIRTLSGYKMVCKDGPVFAARDIIWEEVG